jgi:SPP1 gp7 family putative phage head morphogenesis protein
MVDKIKVSDKRKKWVGNRTTNLRGKPLKPNVGTQEQYEKKIARLLNTMAKEVEREIMRDMKSRAAKEFAKEVGQDASITSSLRILMNKLSRKYDRVFAEHAKGYARWLAEQSLKNSSKTLGTSLKELSGGLTIKTDFLTGELREQLKASIEENVDLIKSIKTEYFDDIRGDIFRSITQKDTGGLKGLQERIQEKLSTRYKQQRNRAKNIALDQTRKTYNNINAERMQAVGVKKFIWRHSGGSQNPREDHMKMDGNVYSFDDPPVIDKRTGERGLPGEAINCRCYMEPVLSFDDGEQD